jgi:hypothetical protein
MRFIAKRRQIDLMVHLDGFGLEQKYKTNRILKISKKA